MALTTQEILNNLNTHYGIVADEAWYAALSKTATSKNIIIADWNAAVLKISQGSGNVDTLKDALVDAIEALAASNEDIEDTNDRITTLKSEIDNRITTLKSEIDNRFKTVEKNISDNATDIADETTARVAAVKNVHTELNNSITGNRGRITTLETNLSGYKNATDDSISKLQTSMGKVTQHVTDSEGRFTSLESRVSKNENDIEYGTDRIPVSVELLLNPETYKIQVKLTDGAGSSIVSNQIDLPLESSVVAMRFDDETKELVLTDRSGGEVRVPISNVLRGVVTNLTTDDDTQVLAASVGKLILQEISDAVSDKVTVTYLTENYLDKDRLPQTYVDKTTLSSELKKLEDSFKEATGILPSDTIAYIDKVFGTNGTHGLEYTLYDESDGESLAGKVYCTGIGNVTVPKIIIGDIVKNKPVTAVGTSAFYENTTLLNVTILDGITEIQSLAFAHCSNLRTLYIGSGLLFIRADAFSDCTSITDVYYNGTEESWTAIAIATGNDALKNAKIHYKGEW